MSPCQLKCDLLWALCRKHGWGQFVSSERLLRDGLPSSQRGHGRAVLDELVWEPYVEFYPGRGSRIGNDPDSQALATVRLEQTCGLPRLTVEATLSRFEQAGGFEAYDIDALSVSLGAW